MNWNEFSASPTFQQADNDGKERLRSEYWYDHIAPHVPAHERADTRHEFDHRTDWGQSSGDGSGWDYAKAFAHAVPVR